jgi:hypothetical protein
MHRDKGNTAADSRNSDGSIQYSKGVGTNGTLVHEMSPQATELADTGESITDVKRIAMFSI